MSNDEVGVAVYVPSEVARKGELASISSGAGIVGSPEHNHIRVDFENRGLRWSDRVARAAERHITRASTPARSWVSEDALIKVGEFIDGMVVPNPWRLDAIRQWIDADVEGEL